MIQESDMSLIRKYAELCAVNDRLSRIESTRNEGKVNIGFIGPFSAGKTSLINALLGTKLPVDIEPTTKSICVIEADDRLANEVYYRDVGARREEIDFLEFTEILCGKGIGDCVLRLPPCEFLQPGVTIVDTPGVDSMGREEKARTNSYLSLMDAAVVCIPVSDGSVKKSVRDFICGRGIRPFASNLIFAITMCDTKSPSSVDAVKAKVISDIEAFVHEGLLQLDDVADRVFAVSQKTAKEQLSKYLAEKILPAKELMLSARFEKEIGSFAGELVAIVKDRAEAMRFDDSQFEDEQKNLELERDEITRICDQKRKSFENAEEKLHDTIFDIMMTHKNSVTAAADDESLSAATSKMMGDVTDGVTSFCQRYVKEFSANLKQVAVAKTRFAGPMKTIADVRDMSVMALTAVATAWFAPGAGAAANAGEAAAGAATQGMAKEVTKTAAKTAAKSVGKEAAKSFMSKAVGCIATVIKNINPLEHIGDFVANKFKASSFEETARYMASSIASNVMQELAETFETEVVDGYRARIRAFEKALADVRSRRSTGLSEYHREYDQLLADASTLEKMAQGH